MANCSGRHDVGIQVDLSSGDGVKLSETVMGNSSRRLDGDKIRDVGIQVDRSSEKEETEEARQQRISQFIRDHRIKQLKADGSPEDANSFGEIEFEGFENKKTPYIRVAENTHVVKLWKLLIEEWKLPKPKMIISITDGAKQSVGCYEDRLMTLLNQELLKAAIDTVVGNMWTCRALRGGPDTQSNSTVDAWIINDGSTPWVMQKRGRVMGLTEGEKVVTLGIADWNVTPDRETLTNYSSTGGLWPARYRRQNCREGDRDEIKRQLVCHNSHFIFVDNGSGSSDINLRAMLERYILRNASKELRKDHTSGSTIIPFVIVVVGGGYETIETVHSVIEENEKNGEGHIVDNTRVFIFDGSGGAADIIAKAIHRMDKKFNGYGSVQALKNDIQHKLVVKREDLDACVNLLKKISDPQHRKLITVFQMENLKDIEGTNLRTLLRVIKISKFVRDQYIKQRTADGKEDANSFGEIEFEGFTWRKDKYKRAPYIRVADDTHVGKLWKLMIEEWKIPKPKMIISITGGTKLSDDAFLQNRPAKFFNKELVEAAINTDAWIINDGSIPLEENRDRTMGFIEEAEKVVVLGIADWNVTTNKEALTNTLSTGGLWPATYSKQDCRRGHRDGFKSTLDCNNSHFILVDKESGTADINFRDTLERYIQRNANTNSSNKENTIILVLLLVVGGNYGTIQTVHSALVENEMKHAGHKKHVLILDESGGAADIIVKAIRLMDNNNFNDNDLKNDIRQKVTWKKEDVDACVNVLKEISAHRHRKLITVYQTDKYTFVNEIKIVLRGMKISKFVRENDIKQRIADGKEDANSFGEINFDTIFSFGNATAPYIRVADDTPVEILWKLMIEEWKFHIPKMIISLTGGAQDYVGWNRDRLKVLLSQGLLKTAVDTDAWIITDGTALGVTQKLGEAIAKKIFQRSGEKVVALGIADWNTTYNKEALTKTSSNESLDLWPARYQKYKCGMEDGLNEEGDCGSMEPLECNHTHFILVDGAKESNATYSNLRSKLERHILHKSLNNNGTVDIPVVMVVAEGGYRTTTHVHAVLKQNDAKAHTAYAIPVVIVGGSGGAADIIVKALLLREKNEFNDHVEDLKNNIRRILRGKSEQVDDCVSMLKEITDSKNRKLISVFQIDDANSKDIDGAIFRAVWPALTDEKQLELELALALNRCGIAKEELLNPDKLLSWQINNNILNDTMLEALIQNRADFVELLLPYLGNMDYLVRVHMEYLSNKVVNWNVRQVDILFSTTSILREKFGYKDNDSSQVLAMAFAFLEKVADIKFDVGAKGTFNPDQHLFLWAVLLNRRGLAVLYFKRLTNGNIGAALIACRILRALAAFAKEKQQLILHKDLMEHAQEYENAAIGILENIHEAANELSYERYRTYQYYLVLVRKLYAWGNKSCLSIAHSSKNPAFIKHDICQDIVDSTWKGHLSIHSKKHWITLILGTVLPLFSLILVPACLNDDYHEIFFAGNSQFSLQRLAIYYRAPITKFAYNTVSYITLLFLFAIFIMTDLRPREELNSPGTIEWIVIAWVGTLIVEEVRQMSCSVKKWFSEIWNRFDLVMYLMFSLSLALRFLLPRSEFGAARVMYSLTFIAFCLRLLHMGFVFKEVGPRIVMITKIIGDLFFFVFMMALFIVSFGIAQEATLNPNVSPSFQLMLRPFYKQYWQLFGELGFEEDEGVVKNSTCNGDASFMNTCFDIDKYQWMAPALTAIYMLISSILLINIFIAIFSVTLERAEDNAEAIWMYHRYSLLLEYLDRPILAPPLIIINHICRLIVYLKRLKHVYKKYCSPEDRQADRTYWTYKKYSPLSIRLGRRDDGELSLSENKHSQIYFIKKKQQQTDNTEKRLEKVLERIIKVEKKFDKLETNVEKKVDNMKSNVDKTDGAFK